MIAFTNSPPLATYILLAYRQADLVGKAIESALAQTYPNLEIIISDDCSPDDTWEVIQKTVEGYKGPHKIILNRTEHNRGLVGHTNALFAMAHGEVVINAGGDDIACPDRAARIMEVFREHPEASMVGSEYDAIQPDGSVRPSEKMRDSGQVTRHWNRTPEDFLVKHRWLTGAVLAYRRELFERFGPLDPSCWVEDVPMVLRAFMCGEIWWIEAPLVHYRTYGGVSTAVDLQIAPVIRRVKGLASCYRQVLADAHRLNDPAYARLIRLLERELVTYIQGTKALTGAWPWPSIPSGIAFYRHAHDKRNFRRRILFVSLVPRCLRSGFFRLLRVRKVQRSKNQRS